VPELKKYMERRVSVKLDAGRLVTGTLRGFDQFMNLVLEDSTHEISATESSKLGTVVSEEGTCCRTVCSLPRLADDPGEQHRPARVLGEECVKQLINGLAAPHTTSSSSNGLPEPAPTSECTGAFRAGRLAASPTNADGGGELEVAAAGVGAGADSPNMDEKRAEPTPPAEDPPSAARRAVSASADWIRCLAAAEHL
jgi:small nuclear ribonucleoprotein G